MNRYLIQPPPTALPTDPITVGTTPPGGPSPQTTPPVATGSSNAGAIVGAIIAVLVIISIVIVVVVIVVMVLRRYVKSFLHLNQYFLLILLKLPLFVSLSSSDTEVPQRNKARETKIKLSNIQVDKVVQGDVCLE